MNSHYQTLPSSSLVDIRIKKLSVLKHTDLTKLNSVKIIFPFIIEIKNQISIQ